MAARRGRGPLVAVVVVLVLFAGLVLADRLLHRYVEGRVADQLQTSLGTAAPPTVDIQGFPFLTQVAANRFRQVDVTASGVVSPERQLAIDTMVVHLHDVRTADRYRRITASTLDGQVTLGYAAVSTLATTPITFAGADASGQGRVQTTVSTTVLDQQLTITLAGVLGVDEPDQELTVSDPSLSVAGIEIPATVVRALADRFLPPLPVGELPLGVRLQSVVATDSGVAAELGGTDVVISGG